MVRVDIGGNVVEFPDSMSPEELQAAVSSAAKQLNVGSKPPQSEGVGSKIGRAAMTVATSPLDVLAAPFQAVGEAMRMPIEGDANFRAPTILQKIGAADKTAEPPGDPFNIVNRLIRSGATGLATRDMGAVRREYHRPPNLLDTASDVALGMVAGKVAPGIANAPIDAIANAPEVLSGGAESLARGVGKKLIRGFLGPSEEAQSARFADPAKFKAAPFESGVADNAATAANQLSSKIKEADTAAWKTLRTSYDPYEGAVSKDEVLGLIKEAKKELTVHGGGTVGKASKGAAKALAEIENDIQDVGKHVGGTLKSQQGVPSITRKNNYLPEATVKGIIQKLDENIDWDATELKPVNDALESTRVRLDGRLKGQNKAYDAAMKPVSEMIDAREGMRVKMGLVNERGKGLLPGNTTPDKVKQIARKEMPETDRLLESVKKNTGVDIQDQANTASLKREFNPDKKDNARGSARTLAGMTMGNVVGWITGHPAAGAMVGAGTGRLADVYGGDAAGALIDAMHTKGLAIDDLIQALKASPKRGALENLAEQMRRVAPASPATSRYVDQRR